MGSNNKAEYMMVLSAGDPKHIASINLDVFYVCNTTYIITKFLMIIFTYRVKSISESKKIWFRWEIRILS
jgi:hypothetical protein